MDVLSLSLSLTITIRNFDFAIQPCLRANSHHLLDNLFKFQLAFVFIITGIPADASDGLAMHGLS